MRHRLKGRTLGRTSSHRHAMFSNMAASLIKTVTRELDPEKRWIVPGRIETTVPKAKELRPYVEKLVTMARRALPHQAKGNGMALSSEWCGRSRHTLPAASRRAQRSQISYPAVLPWALRAYAPDKANNYEIGASLACSIINCRSMWQLMTLSGKASS